MNSICGRGGESGCYTMKKYLPLKSNICFLEVLGSNHGKLSGEMLGAGALGQPRGMVWGGRSEKGSG